MVSDTVPIFETHYIDVYYNNVMAKVCKNSFKS